MIKLGIFAVFGSLLTFHGLFEDGVGAVGVVAGTLLLARPVAIWAALAGTGLDSAAKAFMAWFGPKGVATMAFSLLILSHGVDRGGTDLQPRRADGPDVDPPARRDRYGGTGVDRSSRAS